MGFYDDGTIGEVFVDTGRAGTEMRDLLTCFALCVSLGLQYGIPVAEFRRILASPPDTWPNAMVEALKEAEGLDKGQNGVE